MSHYSSFGYLKKFFKFFEKNVVFAELFPFLYISLPFLGKVEELLWGNHWIYYGQDIFFDKRSPDFLLCLFVIQNYQIVSPFGAGHYIIASLDRSSVSLTGNVYTRILISHKAT